MGPLQEDLNSMPAGAAIPLMAAGTAASGIGSIFGAASGGAKNVPVPPPAPVYPGLNSQFITALGGTPGYPGSAAGPNAIKTLSGFAQNGMPTDVGKTFQTYVDQQKILTQLGQSNIISGLGAQGLRYGSSTNDALGLYNAQNNANFASTLANMLFQTQESAANRQMSAATILSNLFGQTASTLAPTSVVTGGTPSPTGAGLSSFGSGIQTLALLQQLGIFGGNGNGS
jgi:hypothetical protein